MQRPLSEEDQKLSDAALALMALGFKQVQRTHRLESASDFGEPSQRRGTGPRVLEKGRLITAGTRGHDLASANPSLNALSEN